jgi:ribose 5-phosphate isomerase A
MGEGAANEAKRLVGRAAADRVESGMIVGLGTGSTAKHAIARLGERLAAGELTGIAGIPTSFQSSVLAREYKVPLIGLDQTDRIDVAIDGADEVFVGQGNGGTPAYFHLIKGGGGAHTREKIVAANAAVFVVVVDESKLVDQLGSVFPVPVEVLPMAQPLVAKALIELGAEVELRMAVRKAGPVVTDQGNLIIDARFTAPSRLDDPVELERTINNIPGVLDNGIFANLASIVLIGSVAGGNPSVRELEPKTTMTAQGQP